MALGVYMDVAMGVAGLGAAGRAGVQGGARFAAWHNVLRGFLLSADDAAQVARAVLASKRKKKAGGDESNGDDEECEQKPPLWGGWSGLWSFGDKFSIGFGAFSLLLIMIAPFLIPDSSVGDVLSTLAEDLHPWP